MPSPTRDYGWPLLEWMTGGRVVVGTLGKHNLPPNRRYFERDDGVEVYQRTITGLLRMGYLKVVNTSGEDPPHRICYMITDQGRRAVLRRAAARERV